MNPEKRLAQIIDCLDKIERGMWHELTLSRCCDYLAWFAKYHKLPKEVYGPVVERCIQMMEDGFYD